MEKTEIQQLKKAVAELAHRSEGMFLVLSRRINELVKQFEEDGPTTPEPSETYKPEGD